MLTIELPNGTLIQRDVSHSITLKEIAILVDIDNPAFFCYRRKGELGTLISMLPNDDPLERFNTDSIALIDRNHIQEKDVPRYYNAMTKGY